MKIIVMIVTFAAKWRNYNRVSVGSLLTYMKCMSNYSKTAVTHKLHTTSKYCEVYLFSIILFIFG